MRTVGVLALHLFTVGLACLLVLAAPAKASPYEDIGFLMVLDRNHITYTSASDAIAAGHAICEALLAGLPRRDVIAAAASAADKLPLSLVGVLVDAAVEAYCPETAATQRMGGQPA